MDPQALVATPTAPREITHRGRTEIPTTENPTEQSCTQDRKHATVSTIKVLKHSREGYTEDTLLCFQTTVLDKLDCFIQRDGESSG
eukprot:2077578-Amphidinium_carterae.2